jgi:acetyltransferase-like isoleucine patch superfamily enzyme
MSNPYEDGYLHLVETNIHYGILIGKNVKIGEYCIIEEGCSFGDNVIIGHHCVLRPKTIVGNESVIAHGVVCEGWTTIGRHTVVHDQSHLTMGMVIGDDTFLGPCVITSNTRHISHGRQAVLKKIVGPSIGSGVRIGAGALILPGVVIGDDVVVGAGSVVTKDIPNGEIWYGNPAKKMGEVPSEERIYTR